MVVKPAVGNRKNQKTRRTGISTLKAIISYIFFWPSWRKYATYLYMFFRGKKEKDKYDYWKKE